MKKFISILALFILSFQLTFAQEFEFSKNRKRETLSFRMIKNMMIIQVQVNGKGLFNFILDTGVSLLLITDPRLIDSVSIKRLRNINIVGFGEGENLNALITPSIDIKIGNTNAKHIPAAILKKDIFELSNYLGLPIHGLIGYEFFNSFVVRINFSTSTLTIYRPDKAYFLRKGSRIPISIEDRKPYILAPIKLKSGQKILAKLIIDTGAGHPISLEMLHGIPISLPDERIEGNLGIGLAGPINGYIGRIETINLGKYILHNVIAAFPDYEDVASRVFSINRNGNMGISVLKRFNVVFDYGRSALYIRPSSTHKKTFEHDMSGMEISAIGKSYNRFIITRIEPLSAAEAAGLLKGDEIISINFKPVSEIGLSEIENMFHSRNGRSFVLEVRTKDEKNSERIILTLKKRI